MTDDTHLDGNSLGGLLKDLFGREMTHHRGCCDLCGSISHLGTLVAYRDAPGDVARCPNCGTVVMVAVSTPTGLRVNFESLRWVEVEEAGAG
jgi:hypothetical protein